MTITHHLDDATLMSFAAGALPAALAAVAAAHADMCPRCRREIAAMERLGGAVMADLSPAAFERAEPVRPLPMPAGAHAISPPRAAAARRLKFPRPVEWLLSGGLDAVAWRWLGPESGTTLCRWRAPASYGSSRLRPATASPSAVMAARS